MSHTAGNLVLHLIFSTKGRQPLITPEIRADPFACLGGIVREMHGTALIINGTADPVHMLFRIRAAVIRWLFQPPCPVFRSPAAVGDGPDYD